MESINTVIGLAAVPMPINQAPTPQNLEGKGLQMLLPALKPEASPAWLAEWSPAYGIPEVSVDIVKAEIINTENALRPAGLREAAVILERTMSHFGVPSNWAQLAKDYIEELSTVPADLLEEMRREVIRKQKFFPKIADLYETINDKLSARRHKLARLKMLAHFMKIPSGDFNSK